MQTIEIDDIERANAMPQILLECLMYAARNKARYVNVLTAPRQHGVLVWQIYLDGVEHRYTSTSATSKGLLAAHG